MWETKMTCKETNVAAAILQSHKARKTCSATLDYLNLALSAITEETET